MSELGTKSYVEPISKEVPKDYGKDLTGRLVTFGEGEDMSWGVEVDIPLSEELRTYLADLTVTFPPHIKSIKFLTLSPQESLPVELRNIRSNKRRSSKLQEIVDTTTDHKIGLNGVRPYDMLDREFTKVIPNKEDRVRLESILNSSPGSEILLVQGHGGGDPMDIGEQFGDTPMGSDNVKLQRKGNSVTADELISRYNNPGKFSAILLDSCYTGSSILKPKDIPVVYVEGQTGLLSNQEGTRKTVFVLPDGVPNKATV